VQAGVDFVHGVLGLGQAAVVDFAVATDGVDGVAGLHEAFDIFRSGVSLGRDEAGMTQFAILAGQYNISAITIRAPSKTRIQKVVI
jgi:hypothetical protein